MRNPCKFILICESFSDQQNKGNMEQTDSRKLIKKIAKNYQQRTNQINKIQKSIRSMKNQVKSLVKKSELGLPPIAQTISNSNKLTSPLSFNYNKMFAKQQGPKQLRQKNEETLKAKDHYLIRKLLKAERNRNILVSSLQNEFENDADKSRDMLREQSFHQVASQSLKQYLQDNRMIFTNSTNPRITWRRPSNLNMSALNHTMEKLNSVSFKQNSPPKYTAFDDQIGLTSQIQQALMRTNAKFSEQKDNKKSQIFNKVHVQNLQKNIKNLRYEQERVKRTEPTNLKTKKKQITYNQCIPKQENSPKKTQKMLIDRRTISYSQQAQQQTVKKRTERKKTQPKSMRSRQSKITGVQQFETQYFPREKYTPWENSINQFELDNGLFQRHF